MRYVKNGMSSHFLANGDQFFWSPEPLPQRTLRRQQERKLKKILKKYYQQHLN